MQLVGFLTQWEGLAFATVKSAGHRVIADVPSEALLLFSTFLNDTLNSTTIYTDYPNSTPASIGIQ